MDDLQKVVKTMTDDKLKEIWEDSLKLPIEEPIPELVAVALSELVDREAELPE